MRPAATRDSVFPLRPAKTDVTLPEWALVLSTYRRRDVLMLCLQAALAQTRPPAEIIIVDASADWEETRDQVLWVFLY